MPQHVLRCAGCNALYPNVEGFDPAETYRCPRCGEILSVQEAPAAQEAHGPHKAPEAAPSDSATHTTDATHITFACSRCGAHIAAPAALAGRRVRCEKCGQRVKAPAGAEQASPEPVGFKPSREPLQRAESRRTTRSGRRRKRKSKRTSMLAEEEATLDLTPMIDVTFLLLIFFMVTATYVRERFFDLPPPETQQDKPEADLPTRGAVMAERTILTILTRKQGDSVLVRVQDGEEVPLDQLREKLEKYFNKTGKRDVVIEMEPNVLHGALVRAIDIAASARAENVFLGVKETPPKNTPSASEPSRAGGKE